MNKRAILFVLAICVSTSAFAGFNGPVKTSIAVVGGKSMNGVHGQVSIASVQFDFARAFRPRTDFTFGFAPWFIQEPKNFFVADGKEKTNVKALHLAIGLRHHFRSDSAATRPYVEIGSGPMWSDKPVPATSSHFNFDSYGTVGATFQARNGYQPYAGFRFQHISNGGYKGDRNPGFNISAVVFGVRLVR